MPVSVQDNADRRRFELLLDGEVAGVAAYRIADDAVVITHTEVDAEHRGEGLGERLAEGALRTLAERGQRLVPQCPFIARYLKEHPEYADLVAN